MKMLTFCLGYMVLLGCATNSLVGKASMSADEAIAYINSGNTVDPIEGVWKISLVFLDENKEFLQGTNDFATVAIVARKSWFEEIIIRAELDGKVVKAGSIGAVFRHKEGKIYVADQLDFYGQYSDRLQFILKEDLLINDVETSRREKEKGVHFTRFQYRRISP